MKINLNNIDPLFRREMRERWRRPLTYILLSFYVVFLAWISFHLYSSTAPPDALMLEEGATRGRELFITFSVWQLGFWILAAFLLSAPAIVAEKERGGLTDLLLAGQSPSQIVYSKFYSLASAVLVIALIPIPILALCFLLGGLSVFEFICVTLSSLTVTLAAIALGVCISSLCQRTSQAMGMALICCGGITVLFLPLIIAINNLILSALVTALLIGLFIPVILSGAVNHFEHLNRFPASPPVSLNPDLKPVRPEPDTEPVKSKRRLTSQDIPATSVAAQLMYLATFNPISLREMRSRLNTSEISIYSPTQLLSWREWWVVVIALTVTAQLLFPFHWWRVALPIITIPTMVLSTVRCSDAFVNERKKKMLSSLQMTALTPLEIVCGKVYSSLLASAWDLGLILLVLILWSFGYGILWGVGSLVLITGLILLPTTLSMLFSLNCGNSYMAAAGALITMAFVLVCIPFVLGSEFLTAPAWIETWLIVPLQRLWRNPYPGFHAALISIYVGSLFLCVSALAVFLALLQLRNARDEAQGESFWHRDLSRNWR